MVRIATRIPLTADECGGKGVGEPVEIVLGAIKGRAPTKQGELAWHERTRLNEVRAVVDGLIGQVERNDPVRNHLPTPFILSKRYLTPASSPSWAGVLRG